MRLSKIILPILLLFVFVSVNKIYGYWDGTRENPRSVLNAGGEVVIGYWYMADENDPDYNEDGSPPPVVIFDPKNPPNFKIKKGSIVKYIGDKETKIYKALKDVHPNDNDFDPSMPNDYWGEPMVYSEDTAEYRWFHHYHRDDLVIHNGKLYKWNRIVNHNPNTITQIEPPNKDYWTEVSPPENIKLEYLWYGHKIYNNGDLIYYEGNFYKCILGGRTGFKPSNINSRGIWKEVNIDNIRARFLDLYMLFEDKEDLLKENKNKDNLENNSILDEDIDENLLNSFEYQANYRSDKTYREGDFALFESEIFIYVGKSILNESDLSKEIQNDWIKFELPTNLQIKDLWFRYVKYNKDDLIYYNGNKYKSLIDENIEFSPDLYPDKWELLDEINLENKEDEKNLTEDRNIITEENLEEISNEEKINSKDKKIDLYDNLNKSSSIFDKENEEKDKINDDIIEDELKKN